MKKTLLNGILCAGALVLGVVSANAQLFVPGANGGTPGIGISNVAGNVGIGTASPKQRLHIADGSGQFFNTLVGSWYGGDMISFNINYDGSKIDNNTTSTYGAQLYLDRSSGRIHLRNSSFPNGFASPGGSQLQYPIIITKEGNTAIGNGGAITDPQAKLHVFDNAIIGPALTTELSTVTANFNSSNQLKLRLFVNGIVGAKEFRCSLTNWADDVFNNDYKLKPLNEVESFIKTYKHLPEVPSEKEVVENGMEMGEMMKVHMKKIEELTLYMIELQKQNEKLAAEVSGLKK